MLVRWEAGIFGSILAIHYAVIGECNRAKYIYCVVTDLRHIDTLQVSRHGPKKQHTQMRRARLSSLDLRS